MAGFMREEEKAKIAGEVTDKEMIKEGEEKSVDNVREKLEKAEFGDDDKSEMAKDEKAVEEKEQIKAKEGEGEGEENVKVEIEPKTGVAFPVKLADGKQLDSLGLRRKKVIAININIYAFGMYADNAKLKELFMAKFGKAPSKPTKELYEAVIDSDIGMMVRLIIVFRGLTMNMVRKNFDEGLGESLKKLNGGQRNDELLKKVMGAATDDIKLSPGSVIEISRLPGYTLQMKVKDELISQVESELLCRAYFNMYLGDDPFDKEAKESFGKLLLSLF
uniref:Chalcone--flavanone isomerase n=1 Tax=Dracaena cambodiana TaxID=580341 RepID=A0A8A5KGS6_9ASPA|nr:fatty-acid-binding protein [Dracaena cambodiana]